MEGPEQRRPGAGAALTDGQLSLLLSRDLLLARRFFLCSGRDSRIISSSQGGVAVQAAFLWKMALSWCPAAPRPPLATPRPTGLRQHKARLHLLAQLSPQHASQSRGRPHVLQAGHWCLGFTVSSWNKALVSGPGTGLVSQYPPAGGGGSPAHCSR